MWPFPDDGSFSSDRRRFPATDSPDVRLAYRVAEALLSDERIRHQRVAVEVQNRVVLLSGSVDSNSSKQAAGDAAGSITGVADICNTLRVTDDSEPLAEGAGEFQRMVAEWDEPEPPGGGRLTKPHRSMVLWSVLAAGTWLVLTLLIVTSQWTGVALTCVAIGLILAVVNRRRRTRSGSVHPTKR
uniref:BON domain-containing protein n=1 Tax=Paractinoplanes polyasparticus TaxID=2856853 RepID=UPI001C858032|nr:BON domain-containing protein [Actinoplanes polyasparticus]